MSLYINTNNGPVYSECNVTIINGESTKAYPQNSPERKGEHIDDVQEVDTSFFCTKQFAADIIEKNLRQAIETASSKADACRRIMALETQGYILLSNVKDDRKAELINPFSMPKYNLHGDDFRKARNG
jgi:hypothetical protein